MSVKNYRRLRILYLFCALALAPALYYGNATWWIISVCFYLHLQVIGVGIGLHRYVAHGSFKVNSIIDYYLLVVASLSAMGSPISWAAIHRYHHDTSDTEKDPHSYRHMGIWAILVGKYNKNTQIPKQYFKDLLKDKFLMVLHRNYFKLLLGWAALLFIINPKLFLFGFCVPIVYVYLATAFGIILNHSLGYRTFSTQDKSVNSWILSILTLGDGWHNNHHHRPQHYSHRVKWWEFDLCALLILCIRRKTFD